MMSGFRSLYRAALDEYNEYEDPRIVAPNVSIDDYYLDTEAFFETVTDKVDEIESKWREMKESGKYRYTHSPKSDSEYLIDEQSGDVYRMANHWGRCASCFWDSEMSWGIGSCNVKNFKRKFGVGWLNPKYQQSMITAAETILSRLNDIVSDRTCYLTLPATQQVRNMAKQIFADVQRGAALEGEELENFKQRYKELFSI